MFFIILVNVISLTLNYNNNIQDDTSNLMDDICLGIYISEFIIKILALGINNYFIEEWN